MEGQGRPQEVRGYSVSMAVSGVVEAGQQQQRASSTVEAEHQPGASFGVQEEEASCLFSGLCGRHDMGRQVAAASLAVLPLAAVQAALSCSL